MHEHTDRVIEQFFHDRAEFTIQDMLEAMSPADAAERRRFAEKLERELSVDDRFFFDHDRRHFYSRRIFFHQAGFVITPTEFEIDEGILIPGHRFLPFTFSEVFPSETTLRECGGKNLKLKRISMKVGELIPYHLLLGIEQIGDFLTAEDPEHDIYTDGASPDTMITLSVFDLRAFYRETGFRQGDILSARVLDWEKGIFDFTYSPAKARDYPRIKNWVNEYSLALEKVIADYENYFDLPEFLAWGFFYGGKTLFGSGGASLDEFARMMERVEIRIEQGQSILAAVEKDGARDLPEDVMISTGSTESLEAIMAEAGYPMTMNELDSYMLDNCHNRELEFQDLYARCFGERRLGFADEAQEVIFMNYLEDRWEDLSTGYNRERDEIKAPLRERILELTTERLDWLQSLADIEVSAAAMPKDDMKKLAELSGRLNGILGMLNSEKTEISEDEAESMFDLIDRSAELQSELLEKMNKYMNGIR